MVTTAQVNLKLIGLSTGNTYTWNGFVSDVVSEYWKWNATGTAAAGSDNFIILPNEETRIVDISMSATGTVTLTSQILTNDTQTGHQILHSACISTTPVRSFPMIKLAPNKKFQIKQNT